MIHHPDRGGNPIKFQEIASAYETLSDVSSRIKYDNNLKLKLKTNKKQKINRPKPKSNIKHYDYGEVDLWKQTSGVSPREKYWKEYERRKKDDAYSDPENFWNDLNNWWEKQKK